MEVKNRRELHNKLNDIMNNVYVSRKEKQRQNINQNLVKTYLIEGHINQTDPPSHDDFLRFFKNKTKDLEYKVQLKETEEEFLYKLLFDETEFFLDAEKDKRFFMLHSSERSKSTDTNIDRLLKYIPNFDNVWLSKKLMKSTEDYTTWRGISINHDKIDVEKTEENSEKLNLKINNSSETKVKGLINLLASNEQFSYTTGISHLSLLSQEKQDSASRIIDDLRYDGKFSTRGKSFNSHLWLVNKLYTDYKELVYNIEKNYYISIENNKLMGLPINIEFKRDDLSAEYIIKAIFSNKKPFKLWGYADKIDDGYYKVLAVDLHNGNQGNKINFEITKDFISIYLSKKNCGNTIARLVCNIQQYLDSQIKVWGGKDDELF
ncbi:hypothetical protein [Halanaerobium sp.]|uniref:hypothetical protein n=1 Tax=Halanaerobium sp. TaxID=1895664 RepID=UPI000DE75CFA|nr:hypothetical protein [Halanaerobium sp.]PUU86952.1 MAG: hypothetical protein CI949_3816 [Halanaerobium sp.]